MDSRDIRTMYNSIKLVLWIYVLIIVRVFYDAVSLDAEIALSRTLDMVTYSLIFAIAALQLSRAATND